MKNQFLSRRAQMAFVGLGLWLLLAAWSLSAFWHHIDALGESYRFAAKCGATAGEFALLALILWHCFDRHIGVRRWALILGFVLATVILVHAGALRGLNEARAARIETESRLTERLTAMSRDQAAAVGSSGAGLVANGETRQERAQIASKTASAQSEIARNAQAAVAAEITKTDEAVKAASILPVWYLNGWCYSLLFALSLAFVGVIFILMMNDEDIDQDFNGIPDQLERRPAPRGSGHWGPFEDQPDGARRRRWVFSPEEEAEILAATVRRDAETSTPQRAAWRGGVRVDQAGDDRGN